MKILSLILPLAITLSAVANAILPRATKGCSNNNNCARAVYGTAGAIIPALSSRKADCSSFLQKTVTPATLTVTAIASGTTTIIEPFGSAVITSQQVNATLNAIPVYASACAGASAYASACSCFNITHTTTTLAAPITTTTITAVATNFSCPTGTTQCGGSCFNLKTDKNNCGTCGSLCPSGDRCAAGACVPTNATTCALSQMGECNAPCNGNGNCVCQPTADNQLFGVCNSGVACGSVPTCSQQADCNSNSICLVTCCGTLCIPVSVVCDNPTLPARLFKKRNRWSSESG